jgi:hypothetical protein
LEIIKWLSKGSEKIILRHFSYNGNLDNRRSGFCGITLGRKFVAGRAYSCVCG